MQEITDKTPIAGAFPHEGDPYEFTGANGIEFATDFRVGIELLDGRIFVHRTLLWKGCLVDPEEGMIVCDAKPKATAMAERIKAAGEVNLELWDEVSPLE